MAIDADLLRDNYGPIIGSVLVALASALMFLSRLLVKREVKRIDDRHTLLEKQSTEMDVRVRLVEANLATKHDIREVFARMNEIGDRSEQRHTEIMNLIINRLGG